MQYATGAPSGVFECTAPSGVISVFYKVEFLNFVQKQPKMAIVHCARLPLLAAGNEHLHLYNYRVPFSIRRSSTM